MGTAGGKLWMVGLIMSLLMAGCGPLPKRWSRRADQPYYFSMMDSMMEVKGAYEQENPQVDIIYNFGGSGTLRRQIEQGALIDVFVSASKKEYTRLEESGMIGEGTALLQNRLAVVAPDE
ncbi:molybdate ABC transporter substrate-binding protein [Virgibacillus sediminis]|uniref:Molybdate ABC transporter substrate-binding protein n=1 Tax=Virgibacillus sediminis TaxID=202260 RepID=A0ABV7AAQ5_9BACI